MASIPQYHSDFIFCDFPPPLVPENTAAMWAHQAGGFPFFDNGELLPPENAVNMPSFSVMAPVPERFGVSDMVVPDLLLPEFGTGLCGIAGGQGYYQQDVCEFGEDSNGFVPEFPMVYPSSNNNWGFQVSQVPVMEEPSLKVGKYSVEERKDRILRYLKKRNQRNFNKTIKYECRKTLADKRVRVRGRFAKNNDLCDEQALMKKRNNNNNPHEVEGFYNDETIKIEHEGEDWLQEAMASLMCFPYISG
ncbi:Zinc finger protein [Actinidia chinensis var. chinensis]|uniref:Zinc finger protein n=1 Tax=Actinidia chinensis var. chinensis TaxID=1590841 RepID=A0A2R6QBS3_ACTCC|nr:Zinc finger protein [Actinidia chinensis var. chinensis]